MPFAEGWPGVRSGLLGGLLPADPIRPTRLGQGLLTRPPF